MLMLEFPLSNKKGWDGSSAVVRRLAGFMALCKGIRDAVSQERPAPGIARVERLAPDWLLALEAIDDVLDVLRHHRLAVTDREHLVAIANQVQIDLRLSIRDCRSSVKEWPAIVTGLAIVMDGGHRLFEEMSDPDFTVLWSDPVLKQ